MCLINDHYGGDSFVAGAAITLIIVLQIVCVLHNNNGGWPRERKHSSMANTSLLFLPFAERLRREQQTKWNSQRTLLEIWVAGNKRISSANRPYFPDPRKQFLCYIFRRICRSNVQLFFDSFRSIQRLKFIDLFSTFKKLQILFIEVELWPRNQHASKSSLSHDWPFWNDSFFSAKLEFGQQHERMTS